MRFTKNGKTYRIAVDEQGDFLDAVTVYSELVAGSGIWIESLVRFLDGTPIAAHLDRPVIT